MSINRRRESERLWKPSIKLPLFAIPHHDLRERLKLLVGSRSCELSHDGTKRTVILKTFSSSVALSTLYDSLIFGALLYSSYLLAHITVGTYLMRKELVLKNWKHWNSVGILYLHHSWTHELPTLDVICQNVCRVSSIPLIHCFNILRFSWCVFLLNDATWFVTSLLECEGA